jgi:undecaprenyl-diphosphatase
VDYRLEQWINGPAGNHPTLDGFMRHAATWAEPAFVVLIAIWFLMGWLRGKPLDRQGAITAAGAAALALLANQVITRLWQRDRPFVAHPQAVHVLLAHSSDPSFPSDHAAPAFAIAVTLLLIHRRLGLVVVLGAAVMSYARVYCGDHYPVDVLAGALIGAGAAWVLTTRLGKAMAALRRLADRLILALHLPLADSPRGDDEPLLFP